ncbi:hypothetical protein GQX74_001422 [Glossina fuscipes]|nr:hypothetical protein GQX74_001422 [Glossina fuscipes]
MNADVHSLSSGVERRKLRRKQHTFASTSIGNNHTVRVRPVSLQQRYKGKRRKYMRPVLSTQKNSTQVLQPKISNFISTPTRSHHHQHHQHHHHHHHQLLSSQQNNHMIQNQHQFSFSNRSYHRHEQKQQQTLSIPSSTVRVTTSIDHEYHRNGSIGPTTTTQIKHYIGLNSTNVHRVDYPQSPLYETTNKEHVIIQGNTDIVLYRNIGAIPCPPNVRLVTHRVIPATAAPTRPHRQRGKELIDTTIMM